MKYLFLEILNLFKWVCVGFTLAYFMASYHGLDTSFERLVGLLWLIIFNATNVIKKSFLIMLCNLSITVLKLLKAKNKNMKLLFANHVLIKKYALKVII